LIHLRARKYSVNPIIANESIPVGSRRL